MIFRIIYESIVQSFQSLVANKLRTFLSLLGITIGIFCIIAVKSAVDSLEESIVSGFNELGSDVIYIEKNPWKNMDREEWLRYQRRPNQTFDEYELLKERTELVDKITFAGFASSKTIKYLNNSVSQAFTMGTTMEYKDVFSIDIEKGRYWTQQEYNSGANVVILGFKVSEALFQSIDPIGKIIKLNGQNYTVIGVLKSEGDNMFNFVNYDTSIWVSFNNLKKMVNTGEDSNIGRLLAVKAKDGVEIDELKDELVGAMRSIRKLRPKEDENFSLNELSMLSQVIDSVFGVLNIAGFIIGIFALIVGMFSVANIMFVSVKERTNIIGIKKAIGAKKFVILLEFLIEAVILCILGGAIGLGLVFIVLKVISGVIPFHMGMSLGNVITGVLVSIVVGIIAGVIPAIQASNMDPVEAMRG